MYYIKDESVLKTNVAVLALLRYAEEIATKYENKLPEEIKTEKLLKYTTDYFNMLSRSFIPEYVLDHGRVETAEFLKQFVNSSFFQKDDIVKEAITTLLQGQNAFTDEDLENVVMEVFSSNISNQLKDNSFLMENSQPEQELFVVVQLLAALTNHLGSMYISNIKNISEEETSYGMLMHEISDDFSDILLKDWQAGEHILPDYDFYYRAFALPARTLKFYNRPLQLIFKNIDFSQDDLLIREDIADIV